MIRLAFALGLLLAASPALAGLGLSGSPKVAFFAQGRPGALSIEGRAAGMELVEEGAELRFTVDMTRVDTGIDLRNQHMREIYVKTDLFPEVTLRIARATVQWPAEVGARASGAAPGLFTAHGVEKPVRVDWEVRRTKAGFAVKASFAYDVREHGIEIPSYLGVTVEPVMRAEASFDLVEAP